MVSLFEYALVAPADGFGFEYMPGRRHEDDFHHWCWKEPLFRMLCPVEGSAAPAFVPLPKTEFGFRRGQLAFDRGTAYHRLELRCGGTLVAGVLAPVYSVAGPPQWVSVGGESMRAPRRISWPDIYGGNFGALVRFCTAADRVIKAFERGREDGVGDIVVRPSWFRHRCCCSAFRGRRDYRHREPLRAVLEVLGYRNGQWGLK